MGWSVAQEGRGPRLPDDLNVRPLPNDILPGRPDDGEFDHEAFVREEYDRVEPLFRATTDPAWEAIDARLAEMEQTDTLALLNTNSVENMLKLQARVQVIRELREWPETTARDHARLMERMGDDGSEA